MQVLAIDVPPSTPASSHLRTSICSSKPAPHVLRRQMHASTCHQTDGTQGGHRLRTSQVPHEPELHDVGITMPALLATCKGYTNMLK